MVFLKFTLGIEFGVSAATRTAGAALSINAADVVATRELAPQLEVGREAGSTATISATGNARPAAHGALGGAKLGHCEVTTASHCLFESTLR